MRPLPYAYRARGTGVFQSLFALGQFVSAFVVTAIAHGVGGSVLGAIQLLGIVAVAATLAMAILYVTSRRAAPALEASRSGPFA